MLLLAELMKKVMIGTAQTCQVAIGPWLSITLGIVQGTLDIVQETFREHWASFREDLGNIGHRSGNIGIHGSV